jgi:Ca2+-binding EF-hand superfamily protein
LFSFVLEYLNITYLYIIFLCSNGNSNAQEQNGRASVEPVDAARVSSWLASTEAATMGPHAARASPSDAASSMQQPQTVQERELEAEVQILKARLEATAKIAAQPPDLSLLQSYPEWLEVDGFLAGLKAMGDKALREIFKQFADIQEAENSAAKETATDDVSLGAVIETENENNDQGYPEFNSFYADGDGSITENELTAAEAKEKAAAEAETDKRRLSKQGLAKMFETKNITLSKGKLEELMSRIDTDGNGEIDWLEFRALARSNSDLEMFFKGLPLERVLASCFARGAADQSIEAFFSQKHSDVALGVLKAGHILEAMIADHIKKQNEARASQEQAAGGAKYGAELKGGTVDKFFEGVTGICGEPHPGVRGVCVCARAYDNEHSSVT